MARVLLDIDDANNRIALKAMLVAEGHTCGPEQPEVIVADSPARALAHKSEAPVLTLATHAVLAEAVQAMRQGVFGYILLPFVPGEAGMMVTRALQSQGRAAPSSAPARTIEELEEQCILDTLRRCKNNQAQAARVLGIGRNTLCRKLKKIQGRRAE